MEFDGDDSRLEKKRERSSEEELSSSSRGFKSPNVCASDEADQSRNAQIFVRGDSKTMIVQVDASATVLTVKEMLAAKIGFSALSMMLVYGSNCLRNELTLYDYGISNGCTLSLSVVR